MLSHADNRTPVCMSESELRLLLWRTRLSPFPRHHSEQVLISAVFALKMLGSLRLTAVTLLVVA